MQIAEKKNKTDIQVVEENTLILESIVAQLQE